MSKSQAHTRLPLIPATATTLSPTYYYYKVNEGLVHPFPRTKSLIPCPLPGSFSGHTPAHPRGVNTVLLKALFLALLPKIAVVP